MKNKTLVPLDSNSNFFRIWPINKALISKQKNVPMMSPIRKFDKILSFKSSDTFIEFNEAFKINPVKTIEVKNEVQILKELTV